MTPGSLFHPAVAAWFERSFAAPTAAQAQAWPAFQAGRHVLIAAPTGSGKTLAAFLAAIDGLVRQGLDGGLKDETQIVYVSPLKALSNDIQRNLEAPLAGIRESLKAQGLPDVDIRTWVRTGDTPPGERDRMRRRPPHIVVTTPESLYILLGSESGRAMLATTRTVIVDEIHALAANKRGTHLALSLERLAALCGDRLLRVGLSATQKPIEAVARFLVGAGASNASAVDCTIIDTGHRRARDLALELPESPLEAVMSAEVWEQVYQRLAELIAAHRTTLIFVNTRRLAERVTRQLSERLGADQVTAHHGSLAKEQRLDAEQRLKHGKLKALVATASLELGIDIGEVDLVCQLGSPRSIATFLQRVGRSGHAIDGTPKGRLFPLSRDELVECAALLDSVGRGELDRLAIPEQPLDVLAQQIVAEVAAREWNEDELYALVRRASPYRALAREDFAAVVGMLADGFSTRRGRRGALIHHDAVNHVLRGRRGARLTALTSGGTIPDNADYQVLLEPENHFIGTVNEDFAVESMAGDIFQLGNTSYRIMRVERGVVRVEDAHGMAPTIPFWLGEAPGRSDELSAAVSRLRAEIAARLRGGEQAEGILRWLADDVGIAEPAAEQLVEYLAAGHAALGCLPTHDTIVFERFFDEVGGMQLVIHSPYGSRINRAWGLALRKRFCRKFNFELQAAATEDNIVLSLTTAHSFELADVARYLHSATIRPLLDPGAARCADVRHALALGNRRRARAAALPRRQEGGAAARAHGRRGSDRGGLSRPDRLRGKPPRRARDPGPSVGAPDHRRLPQRGDGHRGSGAPARAHRSRRHSHRRARPDRAFAAGARGALGAALRLSRRRAAGGAPHPSRDEPALALAGDRRPTSAGSIRRRSRACAAKHGPTPPTPTSCTTRWSGSASSARTRPAPGPAGAIGCRTLPGRTAWRGCMLPMRQLWIAAERLPQFRALWPDAELEPAIAAPAAAAGANCGRDEALVEILRGRLEGLGPVTREALAAALGLAPSEIAAALAALEAEGFAMRGRFTPAADGEEWCERRLLARIHGYTVKRLRAEIEPVAARDFLRFLLTWQRVAADARMQGPDAVDTVVAQLEGFEAPAGGLGERDPAGAARRIRADVARRPLPGGAGGVDAAAAALRAIRQRRRKPGEPRAHDPDHAAGAPACRALDVAVAPSGRCPTQHPRAGGCRSSFASTGRRSSTSSWTAPACCAPRSRRRWPNWSRSAS